MRDAGDKRHILMCFSCDPCQPMETEHQIARQAIAILKSRLLNVSILTKAGTRAVRDFDRLTGEDRFGCTLTFVNDTDSLKWEPKAALPSDRMRALRLAHEQGIPTWVSLEPVIDPAQTLAIIDLTHEYVDEYKVGTLNYVLNQTDWGAFAQAAKAKLDSYGCHHYLKADLRKWLT